MTDCRQSCRTNRFLARRKRACKSCRARPSCGACNTRGITCEYSWESLGVAPQSGQRFEKEREETSDAISQCPAPIPDIGFVAIPQGSRNTSLLTRPEASNISQTSRQPLNSVEGPLWAKALFQACRQVDTSLKQLNKRLIQVDRRRLSYSDIFSECLQSPLLDPELYKKLEEARNVEAVAITNAEQI
ncbi:hypothetical protein EJ05DRAFT_524938 [Pseudovirgaria hyperparasitica]|uniref:Zn(2)-C6 fungal-type domain-containing protein n=1 Tax=Pseudovirgaria hyperparasitica TaxID=470096 RepID=A0A6A6VRB2_9PEZI|nr:uncharacterized protein EJ05DRAFT_524938 [Pseudovirgaria hyperparasitica]KAF2752685.1 hypothetical protein EJ05DRAFT_524938 [Pseudovirgaria hyperparasitica]